MDEKKIVSFLRFVFGMAFILSGLRDSLFHSSHDFLCYFGLMLLQKFHVNPLDDKAKMPKWEHCHYGRKLCITVVFYWLSGATKL